MTKFFSPQKLNVVDAFKNFEGSEEEKNAMLGYITRAKMTDKAFSSLRGYFVVPDEENKKLSEELKRMQSEVEERKRLMEVRDVEFSSLQMNRADYLPAKSIKM